MISQGIAIPWVFSTEWISMDVQKIIDGQPITQTLDIVRKTGEVRIFNVDSHWSIEGSKAELSLSYIEANNEESSSGEGNFDFWGDALIEIDLQKDSGKATWKGHFTKEWDGSVEWTRIDQALQEEKSRGIVSRIKRQQQQLRKALLALDKKCAITGEELPEVIDAAHIISASDGGREVLENSILLRADLHRLLDSKRIRIAIDGTVVPDQSLPQDYLQLLANKRLPTEVHCRVARALGISS